MGGVGYLFTTVFPYTSLGAAEQLLQPMLTQLAELREMLTGVGKPGNPAANLGRDSFSQDTKASSPGQRSNAPGRNSTTPANRRTPAGTSLPSSNSGVTPGFNLSAASSSSELPPAAARSFEVGQGGSLRVSLTGQQGKAGKRQRVSNIATLDENDEDEITELQRKATWSERWMAEALLLVEETKRNSLSQTPFLDQVLANYGANGRGGTQNLLGIRSSAAFYELQRVARFLDTILPFQPKQLVWREAALLYAKADLAYRTNHNTVEAVAPTAGQFSPEMLTYLAKVHKSVTPKKPPKK